MKDFSHNIELQYLYRDAGNYKLYNTVVFSNPNHLSLDFIDGEIRKRLIDGAFFNPTQWRLKKLEFNSFVSELDHDFCEYIRSIYTHNKPTMKPTISEFLSSICLNNI